jgi:DNA-binding NarL/FixJ family response regulator
MRIKRPAHHVERARLRPDPDHLRPTPTSTTRCAPAQAASCSRTRRREIAAAVRIVASGRHCCPAVTRAVIEEFARQAPIAASPPPPAVAELTPREQEVFDLLARGLSNPEICKQLVISEATAKTHVARILQKLDLRDRVQAVIYAYETGLVRAGST